MTAAFAFGLAFAAGLAADHVGGGLGLQPVVDAQSSSASEWCRMAWNKPRCVCRWRARNEDSNWRWISSYGRCIYNRPVAPQPAYNGGGSCTDWTRDDDPPEDLINLDPCDFGGDNQPTLGNTRGSQGGVYGTRGWRGATSTAGYWWDRLWEGQ